jgi:tyrosinase
VAYNPRCMKRDFSPYLASFTINASVVSRVMSANNYAIFDLRAQGEGISVADMTYHGGGHLAVGGDTGDVGNPYSSPGDPLFYLHHANMDRLWNKWQRFNWSARKNDIAGPDTQFAYPWNFFGDIPYQNITLDYQMDFVQLLAPGRYIKIREVMDITSPALCYTYDN